LKLDIEFENRGSVGLSVGTTAAAENNKPAD
jgi:hypothetical protein